MNRIKQFRNEEGLTQKGFAEAFNKYIDDNNLTIKPINFSVISKWETGKSAPTKATYEALADFFKVPTEYLMDITNDRVTLTVNDLNPAEEDAYKRITAMLSEDYPKGSISKNKIGRLLADEGLWEE